MANNKPIGVAYADPQLDSFQVGSSNDPIAITSAGVLNGAYAVTSATSGDTRLNFNRLTFAAFRDDLWKQIDHAVVGSVDTASNVGRPKNRRLH